MTARPIPLVLGLALLGAAPGTAQEYLVRFNTRVQSAAYRGVKLDSILVGSVDTSASGGLVTPDGYAVTCIRGRTHCSYFREGAVRRSGPLTSTLDLTAWGFGLRGMSLHLNGRLGVDLGSSEVWPGTRPALQLNEGYAEYASSRLTGRLGRQVERSRLGYNGYDGARLSWRFPAAGLAVIGYGGYGLARASALPVTSDALNPLDEFQPRQRQLMAGAAIEWQTTRIEARADYLREVDRDPRNLVSERAALSATLRPYTGWSLTGGAEYDLAYGWWGSSDLTLRHTRTWGGAAAGVRRYRPYFDLWTLWGVFSPVPYNAVSGSAWVTPLHGLTLRAGGEHYRYDDAEAASPLVDEEKDGWRWNAGLGYALSDAWSVDGGYHAEFGPGAASQGGEGSISWRPGRAVSITAEGGHLVRPLEFRNEDPALTWYGISFDVRPNDRLRLSLAATRYDENRRRGDASTIDWSQTRLRAGLSWVFGSSADQMPLPPAIRRERGR